MKNEIILKITPASVSVLDMELGTSKYIDPEDLLRLISLSNEGVKFRMGRLPDNVMDVALEEPGHIKKVLLFFPIGCFDFKAQERTYKKIEFPSMLFLFEVEGKKITNTKIVALKDITDKKSIKPTTKIYRYPFTHVYDDLHVCWGSNTLPEITSLHQLEGIPYMFVNSHSAVNHLSGKANSSNLGMEQFLTELEAKNISVDDYLVEINESFKSFCIKHLGEVPLEDEN